MNDQNIDMIDAYLDDLLSDDERVEFERRLVSDPELRAEVERQQLIDESLRRVFAPPEVERADEVLAAALSRSGMGRDGADRTDGSKIQASGSKIQASPASTSPPSRVLSIVRPIAIAACVGILCFAGYNVYQATQDDPFAVVDRGGVMDYEARTLDIAFGELIDLGFRPDWVCESDEEFAETFAKRLQQPMVLGQLPPGASMLGLAYVPSISPDTTVMLGSFENSPVAVFVDRIEREPTRVFATQSGTLRAHRRVVGDLVMFEVSMLPDAHFLDSIQRVTPGS
jgi:hypothetical protein